MQQILNGLDLMSIKLAGLSLFLAAIVSSGVAFGFAILASISTILYNYYKWRKESKNKDK